MRRRPRGPARTSATSGSLAGAAGALTVSRYLQAAINWSGTILVIRSLGETEYGRLAFVFALLGMIGLVSDLKIGRVVLRAALEEGGEGEVTAGSYVVFRALIGVVSYAVAMGIVVVGGYPGEVVHATAVAGLVLFVGSCNAALELPYYARLRMGVVALVTTVAQVAQLAAIVGLLGVGRSTVVWLAVPAVVSGLVELALKVGYGHRFYRLTVSVRSWSSWVREAAPLSVGGLLTAMYMRIDLLMLSRLDTFESVGMYSIGYKFADIIESFPGAVMAPAFTLLVQAWPDHTARFGRVFRQSFGILVVVGAGLVVGFAAFAEEVTVFFYGDRYADAAGAARLLVVGQVLNFFSLLCFTVLTAVGRHRLYPVAGVVGVVVNVALNAALIPARSFDGAALATVVTEVVVLAILASGTLRVAGVRPLPLATVARTIAAAAVLAGCVLVLHGALHWLVAATLSGVVYLAAAHLLRVGGPGGLRSLVITDAAGDTDPETLLTAEEVAGGAGRGTTEGPLR